MPRAHASVSLVDTNGDHQRFISISEARKLASCGDRIEICRQCRAHGDAIKRKKFCGAHGKQHHVVYMLTDQGKRNLRKSNAALTFAEMLAAVGLSKRDEQNHSIGATYQRLVREKIQNWRAPDVMLATVPLALRPNTGR